MPILTRPAGKSSSLETELQRVGLVDLPATEPLVPGPTAPSAPRLDVNRAQAATTPSHLWIAGIHREAVKLVTDLLTNAAHLARADADDLAVDAPAQGAPGARDNSRAATDVKTDGLRPAAMTATEWAERNAVTSTTSSPAEQNFLSHSAEPSPQRPNRQSAQQELIATGRTETGLRASAPQVRIGVFGGLRLWRSGIEITVSPSRHRVVLAELISAGGNIVGINELVDVLWQQDPPASAVNQVHRIVGQLRRSLEPGLVPHASGRMIVAAGSGYRVAVDRLECDLYHFRRLVRRAAAHELDAPELAGEVYAAALELAQGAMFAGLDPRVTARPEFVAIEMERVTAAVAAADLAVTHGCSPDTLAAVAAIAANVPLNEPIQSRLIKLLAVNGRRAEALIIFDKVRRHLSKELGVGPGRELVQIYLEVLATDTCDSAIP